MMKKKKSKDTMAEPLRTMRSGAKRAPPPHSAGDGSIAAAKRSRSEPSKNSDSNGRYQLRTSKENGSRAGGGSAAADVPRVLPSTKKVSGVRRTKEEPKPRKRGRPPKSSKALILVVKKKREEVTSEGKASILLAKKKKKKKNEKVSGEGEAEGADRSHRRAPTVTVGIRSAAKRSRSSKSSDSNGRCQLRKSKENGSRAGGGSAAAADIPRVLPSTKMVSGVRRTKEEPKLRKRGRPPKSSKALILVVKKSKVVKGEGKASILLAKKKKKKSEKVSGKGEAEGADRSHRRAPTVTVGISSVAKRSRSEPSKSSGTNGRYQLRKLKENGSRAGGGSAAAADVPRVLPSTKKVSGVRRTKEEPKPRKRGRPPKSSKSLILVVKKKRKEVTGEEKASILKKKTKKKKSENVSGEEEAEGRLALRQRISNQIKSLLLKSGWTIDLRPRNGKDYMDSVYLPPAPYKGSFWSVTKAYQVYLEHRNSSVKLASDPIPEDLLTLLNRQRNSEVGRRRRIGDKIPKKCGRKPKSEGTKAGTNVKKKRKRCALLVRKANEAGDYVPYPWKRTVLSWMIDSAVVTVDRKVNYVNKRKKSLMEGWITRDGIRCGCCSNIVTPLEFEAHAGSKLCRPYENIIEEEGGLSLLHCQINAWEKQAESERKGFWEVDVGEDDPSDDTCCICADGGDLVCCDGCPSTFHLNCLGLEMLPPDDWYCRNCTCKFCGLISGADEDEDEDVDDGTVSALRSCSQCEQKFHQDCVPDADADADAVNVGSSSVFCGQRCKMVFKQLQNLLGRKNDLEEGFSWTLIRRFDDASGTLSECNSKIAVALGVMDECFLSTIDERSGIKLIHNVVYNCGANITRLDFSGFYAFILERADEIISVASVRIHGTTLAEMPYIGTRNMYRRQGMCRRLLFGIESALCSLNIRKLIIPAISELTETWTNIFGFNPLEFSHKQEVMSTNLLMFPGIDLLQKPILKVDSAEPHTVADGAKQGELEIDQHCELELANKCQVVSSLASTYDEGCGFKEERKL